MKLCMVTCCIKSSGLVVVDTLHLLPQSGVQLEMRHTLLKEKTSLQLARAEVVETWPLLLQRIAERTHIIIADVCHLQRAMR